MVEFELESSGLDFFRQDDEVLNENQTYLDRVFGIVLREKPKSILDFGGGTGELAMSFGKKSLQNLEMNQMYID